MGTATAILNLIAEKKTKFQMKMTDHFHCINKIKLHNLCHLLIQRRKIKDWHLEIENLFYFQIT